MKALITGAKGFIGKNLALALHRAGIEVAEIDIESPPDAMIEGVRGASVVFHLAGINRPDREEEYPSGNVSPLLSLFNAIHHVASRGQVSHPLILLSSSFQAILDNPYGRSKLAAEQALREYSMRTRTPAKIYRLPGVFGKWSRPNYNSVVATFCHNIARDIAVTVSDPTRIIELVHIDDVVAEFLGSATGARAPEGIVEGRVEPSFSISLGELAEHLQGFREKYEKREIIDTSDPFIRRLYGTYSSYLPIETLASKLEKKHDARGRLVELLKAKQTGQLFVSMTHPGIVRGNHYHDLKSEKFYVLEGEALIRLRPVLGAEITEYRISGNDSEVVDIPPGVTHNITNIGTDELIVLFLASEIFDPEHPDTYPAEV